MFIEYECCIYWYICIIIILEKNYILFLVVKMKRLKKLKDKIGINYYLLVIFFCFY